MEFARDRLIRRLVDANPRLVLCSAPAGFGKTTLARQFAARFPVQATCDCGGVGSEQEFCRRMIAALSAASPRDDARFTGLQFMVGASPEADADMVLQLWRDDVARSAFVFENAEGLARHQALRGLLGRVLAATPARRVVVVCSRTPVRIPSNRSVPPHEIVSLRAADLAFDRDEIAQTFAEFDLPAATLCQIEAATRGWPIALLVLRRFANEGRLDDLLTRLDDVAFDEVHDYLADEVFGSLGERELDALIACAAIGDATDEDIATALGDIEVADAAEIVETLIRASPLLSRTERGTYEVPPLLDSTIAMRYRRRRHEVLLHTAASWQSRQRPVRAARLYQRLGNRDATARALCAENVATNRVPTAEYTSLVTGLDEETLRRYPVLRSFTTFYRRFRVDPFQLCNDTKEVWDALAPTADFELRCNVGCPLARLMYEVGRFEEAEGVLRALVPDLEGIADGPLTSGQAYVLRTMACIAVRRGRIASAERYLERGYVAVPGARLVMARRAIERGVIERLRGRRDEERNLLMQAIDLARESPMPLLLACALAEASFGAWLAGEDAALRSFIDDLEDRVVVDALRGFAHFCDSARPGATAVPNGTEQPNWLACAYLLRCGYARSGDERGATAQAAVEAARGSGDPFLRTLAFVALGLTATSERERCFATAARIAADVESAPLHGALSALLTGERDVGMLQPFVKRLRSSAVEDAQETLHVAFLTHGVRRGDENVRLGERELALLLALARQRRTYTRGELMETLWPGFDEARAREALNSCLYRLRGRLRDDVVGWTGSGYRLRDDVEVDLRTIEALVAGPASERELYASDRAVFERLRRQIRDRHAGTAPDWLAPVETRIDDIGARITERLARDALRRLDLETVLALSAEMSERDSCDETARELTIRAHLARGDQAAALREYRSYLRILRAELDIEPSEELARIVGAGSSASLRGAAPGGAVGVR